MSVKKLSLKCCPGMLLVQKLAHTQMPYGSYKINGWAREQECEIQACVCACLWFALISCDFNDYLGGLQKPGPEADSNPTSPRESFIAEGLGNSSSLEVRCSGPCSGLLISFNLIVLFCHTYLVCHADTSGLQWFKVV